MFIKQKAINALVLTATMLTYQAQAEDIGIYRQIELSKLPEVYNSDLLDKKSLKKILSRLETIENNYDIIRYSDDPILLATALLSLGIACAHIPTASKNAENIHIACTFATFRRRLLEQGIINSDQLLKFSDDHFNQLAIEFRKIDRSPSATEFMFLR